MKKEKHLEAQINPLQFLEVDDPWAQANKTSSVTHEAVVNFICKPGISSSLDELVNRYKEISTERPRINIAPAEDRILEKLIWPLHYAKSSYMLGHPLGTISLCGMVAEMVSILLFEISKFIINDHEMTSEEQKQIFGSTFEKLGQDRRVQILKAYDIVDENIKQSFDLIRTTRRKYLHLWSHDLDQISVDARNVFTEAVKLVIRAIGQDFKDGKLVLNPALLKYLERNGVYKGAE
ncbi:MAG: hypothetical protein DWQ05_16430 [Calditrichaeota bacterium]|nr:MAG: hypothetical protein DWQ05_16430 [Calditrichota bacterium]